MCTRFLWPRVNLQPLGAQSVLFVTIEVGHVVGAVADHRIDGPAVRCHIYVTKSHICAHMYIESNCGIGDNLCTLKTKRLLILAETPRVVVSALTDRRAVWVRPSN